ncbi:MULTISPECIES: SEC-C metal-binding domain-containing protein [unclassified Mesorhizobium]|uniref:nuclease-related domain-containing protein n=1 Tax=unclassified Mesorhizobium TaxID=325217 RepID=UPI00333D0C7C
MFADLQTLCTSVGYIHAVAYFCWRDNLIRYSGPHVVAKDFDHQHSRDRLLRTEISTLIGLMFQKPIDPSIPEPELIQDYVARSETLLDELHQALMKPWFEGWDFESGKMLERDPFANAAALREPIFYGGESAYNFQYRDLARLKYRPDNDWLEANKGFHIDEACQIAEALGRLQSERQIEWFKSLRMQPPDKWTMLPAFTFTTQDAVRASGNDMERVESFLEAFSCGPDEGNASFTALNEFNITNSTPILKTAHGSYILLQDYSLLEAVYETPFFWMAADKSYSPTALVNRGRFTESFVANRLEAVFGTDRVLRNVDIYKGKNRLSEADALVLYGDRAIVVQAKSKRLTIEARKGNDLQLKDDFKKAVQDAYGQALLCAEALTNDGFRFVSSAGADIAINHKPRTVFPICVVSDHYPALAFQARQFLKANVTEIIQLPLVTDVFAIDVFAEMLNTPLHFLNYLALRARFGDKLTVSHELTALGYHLKHNLWLDAQYDMVDLGDDFTTDLDIAMLARRVGIPGKRTPSGILTRFDRLTIGRLLDEIEKAASPQLTGLGLLLMQLSSKAATFLSAGIDRIVADAERDGKNHDISVPAEASGSGITIHSNDFPEYAARERLSVHCRMRKYDTKADAWYGLLLSPGSGGIRGALVLEEPWQPDAKMDAVMATWQRRPPIPISQLVARPSKIGRNEPCPCGSGQKYKKCCLDAERPKAL